MQNERASKEAGTSTIPSCRCVAFIGDAEANEPDVQQGGCCLFYQAKISKQQKMKSVNIIQKYPG